jgi:hypothetical protein
VEGFAQHAAHQATPEIVAVQIADALAVALRGDGFSRVPIGADAAWMLAERARLNDAGWAARVREMT